MAKACDPELPRFTDGSVSEDEMLRRDAKEGLVLAKTTADNKRAAIIVLNCETDFVAKNEDFGKFANSI